MELNVEGRKWLGRLWDHGIDRSNLKTEDRLEQLAATLGLRSYRELWKVDAATLQERIAAIQSSEALEPVLNELVRHLEELKQWEHAIDVSLFEFWMDDKGDTHSVGQSKKTRLMRILLIEMLTTGRSDRWRTIRNVRQTRMRDLEWLVEEIDGFGLWSAFDRAFGTVPHSMPRDEDSLFQPPTIQHRRKLYEYLEQGRFKEGILNELKRSADEERGRI